MTLEMTTLNGRGYLFVEVEIFTKFVSAYAWYSGKWNRLTRTFQNLEDAKDWVAKMDEDYIAKQNAHKISYELPEGAYSTLTGYYGD